MTSIEVLGAGTELLQYRLVERIGASVWRASDTRNGKDVAIKILTRQLPKEGARREQVIRETRLGAALYHPFLVPIVDVIEAGDALALVMGLVDGEPLTKRLGGKPLPKQEFFNYAYQLVDVVKFLQARNMVHGNINGDSVMITPAGQVKLGGLNALNLLARREGASSPAFQQKGSDTASVAYMAPEQISGQTVDTRADVFAIGVICYQMGTGSLPWVGKAAGDVAREVVEGQPQSPRIFNAQIDPAVMALIGRCIFKDPYKRYNDARAAAEDIAKAFPDAARNANELAARERAPVADTASPESRRSILLLADLANYGDIAAKDENAAMAAASRMQTLAGETIYLFDGKVLDPFGSRVVAEMPSIENAVQAASKVQFDFSPEQLQGEPLPVRILLHAGEVQTESGRVSGPSVTKGFEAMAQAAPLEIFISEEFAKLGRKTLRLHDAGARAGMKLYQLVLPEAEPEPAVPVSRVDGEKEPVPAEREEVAPKKRVPVIAAVAAVVVVLAIAVGGFFVFRSRSAEPPKKQQAVRAAVVKPAIDPAIIEASRTAARDALAKGDLSTAFTSYAAVLANVPNDSEALNAIGRYAAAVGDTQRFSAAMTRLERAGKPDIALHAPDLLVAAGKIDGAIDHYYDVETAQPANAALALKIGRIAVLRRTMTIADIELAKLQKGDPKYGYPLLKAYIAAQQNARAEVDRNLKEALAASVPGDDYWTSAAEIYAIAGNTKEVIASLRKAAERKEPTVSYVLNDPLFAYLATDASFQKLKEVFTQRDQEIRDALARITM